MKTIKFNKQKSNSKNIKLYSTIYNTKSIKLPLKDIINASLIMYLLISSTPSLKDFVIFYKYNRSHEPEHLILSISFLSSSHITHFTT